MHLCREAKNPRCWELSPIDLHHQLNHGITAAISRCCKPHIIIVVEIAIAAICPYVLAWSVVTMTRTTTPQLWHHKEWQPLPLSPLSLSLLVVVSPNCFNSLIILGCLCACSFLGCGVFWVHFSKSCIMILCSHYFELYLHKFGEGEPVWMITPHNSLLSFISHVAQMS